MNWLFKPSLTRRVVLALLLAFGLAGTALVAYDFVRIRREYAQSVDHSALMQFAQELSAALREVGQPGEAMTAVRTMEALVNHSRREQSIDPLLMELRDRSGARVYASPGFDGLAWPAKQAPAHAVLEHAGMAYTVVQVASGPWQLRLAEPHIRSQTLLSLLGKELAPSLLLAFPFVFLPVWLAVRQGLKPLQRLSGHLKQRDADDLTPLTLDLQYADLQPVVHAFNTLLARLHDKVQRERAFVQDAAHELRTPMAVIAAQAHALARAASQAEREQAHDALTHAIERASHLAQQLLALASLDEMRPLQVRPFDLAASLQTWIAQAVPLALKKNMELSLQAPDHYPIESDPVALQSIMFNLIDNAIRYGHEHGRVQVTLAEAQGQCVLTVADDGPGMAEQDRKDLFQRFVRGRHHDVPGTGLGLAIVQQASKRLGGRVEVGAGLDGRGVGMIVHLPVAPSMAG